MQYLKNKFLGFPSTKKQTQKLRPLLFFMQRGLPNTHFHERSLKGPPASVWKNLEYNCLQRAQGMTEFNQDTSDEVENGLKEKENRNGRREGSANARHQLGNCIEKLFDKTVTC